MRHSRLALILVLTVVPAQAAAPGADVHAARISGVYFDGYLRGDPEPEEAIRITNTDPDRVLDLSDFALTDRYGPRRPSRKGQRKQHREEASTTALEDHLDDGDGDVDATDAMDPQMGLMPLIPTATVQLPPGTRVPPGGEIWIAHKGQAFRSVFGFQPGVEGVDTDDRVPDATLSPSWLNLPARQGVVALLSPDGRVADVVAYESQDPKDKPLDLSKVPGNGWVGPPVMLRDSSPYGWKGQVLARDRDAKGLLLPDTDGAADWDSGFSRKQLGTEPIHRIEFPGQTRFITRRLDGVRGRVTCGSAPENQFSLLTGAFGKAKQHIRINVYQLTNPLVGEHIEKALKRGVKVSMLMEGVPVGGMPDDERIILDRLQAAGARILFIGQPEKEPYKPRYRFDHAKYTIIDDTMAIIGTENYGKTGHPPDPSHGNRGFEVAVEHPAFVRQLLDVWDADTHEDHRDLVDINRSQSDKYGMPLRDPQHTLDPTFHKGLYAERRLPLVVEGKMDLELVMSPDTSLSEETAILGMIKKAKREVLVLQNSIPRFWGKGQHGNDDTPNLALMAVLEAARRGLTVRVLMDGTWYNAEDTDARDNDDTARFLNETAAKEGLNLAAKVINLETARLEKIHAKSVLVDGVEVLVSSINWSENSFKGNREMGVIIRNQEVTGYYRELFWRDWRASRLYRVGLRDRDASLLSEPRVGAPSVRKVSRGELFDVVTEVARGPERAEGFLEIPLESNMSGYLRANAAGEHVAVPGETRNLYGREVAVEGRVLEVVDKGKVLILGLDKQKDADFQVVIFEKLRMKMGESGIDAARSYSGRKIRVKGTISRFKGPQIQVQTADQITVVE